VSLTVVVEKELRRLNLAILIMSLRQIGWAQQTPNHLIGGSAPCEPVGDPFSTGHSHVEGLLRSMHCRKQR
jgi:hypothetical protein